MNKYINALHLTLLPLCLLVSSPAYPGFGIGIGRPTVTINGNMDGTSFVGGGGSAEILPDQESGSGTKFIIGGFTDSFGAEMNYVSTEHDGAWLGIPTESEFRSLNFDFKASVVGSGKLRGMLIFGFGFTSVKVKNGSTDGVNVADAKFKGADLRLGAGLRFIISSNLLLEGNAILRRGSYNSVDGIVSGDIDDDISGDGRTVSVELIYVFDD